MKKILVLFSLVVLAAVAIAAMPTAGAAPSLSGLSAEEGLVPAPRCGKDFECLDVWDPVICDNGVVYSNDCYAARACATGCRPLDF